MSKNCRLSLSSKQGAFDKNVSNQDQQYNNINLNQNGPTYMKAEHSESTTTFDGGNKNDYAKKAVDQLKIPHTTSNSWTKLENGLKNLNLNNADDAGESKWKNRQQSAETKGSTLSLHIAAYENAIEKAPNGTNDESGGGGESAVEKKDRNIKLGKAWKNIKNVFHGTSTSTTLSNYFEFPRHPSKAQTSKPEVMQFKASQRLMQSRADEKRTALLEVADELSKAYERNEISKEEFKDRLLARSPELGYRENHIYIACLNYVNLAKNHFEKNNFKFFNADFEKVAVIERRLNPEFCQAQPAVNDSRAEVTNESRVNSLGPDEPAASDGTSDNQTNGTPPIAQSVALQIPNQLQHNGGGERRRQPEQVNAAPSHPTSNNFIGRRSRTFAGNTTQSLFADENLNRNKNAILRQRPVTALNDAAPLPIIQQQLAADANARPPPPNDPNPVNHMPQPINQQQIINIFMFGAMNSEAAHGIFGSIFHAR